MRSPNGHFKIEPFAQLLRGFALLLRGVARFCAIGAVEGGLCGPRQKTACGTEEPTPRAIGAYAALS